jgi:RNA polymerase sigma factor (sigma-70 family)
MQALPVRLFVRLTETHPEMCPLVTVIVAGISSTEFPYSVFSVYIVPDNPASKEDLRLRDPQDSELLDIYYKALSRVKILTRAEEETCISEYQDSTTEPDRKQLLKDKIIQSNLRLVFSMAKSMWDRKDPELLADLIANGNVGLLLALEKFDPKYGTRFCTYAGHWVNMSMRRAFRGLVRTPADKPEAPLAELTEAPDTEYEDSVDEDMDSLSHRSAINTWLRFLSQRERFIITHSYCLGNELDKPASLRDMSRQLGLSSERVRQIRATAIEKLQLWFTYHYPEED